MMVFSKMLPEQQAEQQLQQQLPHCQCVRAVVTETAVTVTSDEDNWSLAMASRVIMKSGIGAGLRPAFEELALDFYELIIPKHHHWPPFLYAGNGLRSLMICLQEGIFGVALSVKRWRLPGLLTTGFRELADDAAALAEGAQLDRSQLAMSAIVMLASSLPVGPASTVVLAGFVVPSAVIVHGFTAVIFTVGALSFLRRFERQETEWTRGPATRGAMVCFTAAGLQLAHLAFALHGGYPAWLVQHVANPDLLIHYLGDLISIPLLEANLCCLVGANYSEAAPAMALSTLTTCGNIASVILQNPVYQAACFGGSVVGIALTGYSLKPLVDKGQTIEALNSIRAGMSRDMLIFTWSVFPLTQGLVALGTLTPATDVYLLGLVDLLNKMGVSHLMLRSPKALQSSYQALLLQQQQPELQQPQPQESQPQELQQPGSQQEH